jgi:FkbM family methyltransferase
MLDRILLRYFRAPEHPAKLRVLRWLGRHAMPPAGIVAPVHRDLRFHLHPRDWIEYLLLRGDAYEPLTLELLEANLRPGDGAILAGTNFGLHVAVAARAVGAAGLVVGVEPQPAALLRARRNLELNGLLPRVRLVQVALGREERLVPMAWSDPENSGAASLLDPGDGFLTPLMRLDSIKGVLGRRPFRLLLLDVQGYEAEALGGLQLDEGPDLAVVELDPEFLARAGSSPEAIVERFTAAGYRICDVHGNPPRDLLALPERNFVAVKPSAEVGWAKEPPAATPPPPAPAAPR